MVKSLSSNRAGHGRVVTKTGQHEVSKLSSNPLRDPTMTVMVKRPAEQYAARGKLNTHKQREANKRQAPKMQR